VLSTDDGEKIMRAYVLIDGAVGTANSSVSGIRSLSSDDVAVRQPGSSLFVSRPLKRDIVWRMPSSAL